MTFSSTVVPIDSLFLDSKNPRFVVQPNSDQKSLIEYLIKYEEIIELARGIASNKGLIPGERIIVCHEDDKYIVLEGNRRTTACKILLNNSLIPESNKMALPDIDDVTRRNILTLSVDIVNDRTEIQSTLYHRHIDGVRDWSPVSKMRFCTIEYDNGMDVLDIAKLMSTRPSRVINEIKNYKLTSYILNLKDWAIYTVPQPDIHKYKYTLITHALETNSAEYKETGYKILKMSYNESFEPVSELPTEVFNYSLYLLAKAAHYDKEFNTRSLIENVPGLIDYLKNKGILSSIKERNQNQTDKQTKDNSTAEKAKCAAEGSATNATGGAAGNNTSSGSSDYSAREKSNTTQSKPPLFFENLTWNALNASNPEHFGLIALTNELKEISKRNHYCIYPISTAMLLRSIFEQLLKYYLKRKGEWGSLLEYVQKNKGSKQIKVGYDPMMKEIVKFLNSSNNYMRVFPDRTIQSAFTESTSASMLDFFDTNIHNTHIIRATKNELEGKFASGLGAMIFFMLNDK